MSVIRCKMHSSETFTAFETPSSADAFQTTPIRQPNRCFVLVAYTIEHLNIKYHK